MHYSLGLGPVVLVAPVVVMVNAGLSGAGGRASAAGRTDKMGVWVSLRARSRSARIFSAWLSGSRLLRGGWRS